ncbi:hypothetical protein PAPYR_4536 [Paratrimastix pyriformis]|uniref:Response regulatory domain-containing protein n=1 Tax=Paratrimastix pyriformis TaxID=342808 RepID=A0ABQ8ULZ3_9EUKA|nr:hypothetical protein PAPYR_4536 [Paratrimastix pyriformis]
MGKEPSSLEQSAVTEKLPLRLVLPEECLNAGENNISSASAYVRAADGIKIGVRNLVDSFSFLGSASSPRSSAPPPPCSDPMINPRCLMHIRQFQMNPGAFAPDSPCLGDPSRSACFLKWKSDSKEGHQPPELEDLLPDINAALQGLRPNDLPPSPQPPPEEHKMPAPPRRSAIQPATPTTPETPALGGLQASPSSLSSGASEDGEMPRLNGLEATAYIRALEAAPSSTPALLRAACRTATSRSATVPLSSALAGCAMPPPPADLGAAPSAPAEAEAQAAASLTAQCCMRECGGDCGCAEAMTMLWKGAPCAPRTPVIACSSAADRAECIKVGMDDYLPKPFTVYELASILGKHRPTALAAAAAAAAAAAGISTAAPFFAQARRGAGLSGSWARDECAPHPIKI